VARGAGAPGPGARAALETAAPAAFLILAYAAFNLAVGGSLLPNTFAAKSAYYSAWPRSLFLGTDVRSVFATGAWTALLPFTLFAIGREATLLAKRRAGALRLEAGWALALPLAYFAMLPFAHRFGRYLVPAVPAVAVLGLAGIQAAIQRLGPRLRHGAAWLVLLAAAALAVAPIFQADREYRRFCDYHYVRHERTGRWLAENTPPDAVIATHDVGAIAFYSGRRVVDIVGVVLPEAVRHLWSRDYVDYLADLFRRTGVTHLALLRDWLEAVNVEPLFVADPEPEVMEVYPWIPGRTHLVPTRATSLNAQAYGEVQRRNLAGAYALFRESLALDDENCRTWLLLGVAHETARRPQDAEAAYRKALALFPGFKEAHFALARLLVLQGRNDEARKLLRALLERQPDFPGAAALLRQIGG
jgi:tetratricopeptide (TPR) repeat protein